MKPWILAFFFVSGLCGLLYEVVWIRTAGTVIGNTTYAIGTVVAVYMGGLALGAWLGGRAADRRGGARLLRLYGLLEGGVALSALAVPFLTRGSEPVFRVLWNAVGDITLLYAALRALLVALLLIVPTTLMGATLPVLARFLSDSAESAPRETGRAYAINTFGGVAGTLAGGFWLIPAFGLRMTTLLAAGLNLAIAAMCLAMARGRAGEIRPLVPVDRPARRLALWISALSGFASLIYEIAWTRSLVLLLGSTVYAFTLILASFILGLAVGSALGSRLMGRVKDPVGALALIEIGAGLAACIFLPFLGEVPLYLAPRIASWRGDPNGMMVTQCAIIALFVLLPTILLGLIFPFACRLAAPSEAAMGRSVGSVYTWNTIGCIAGSLAASFILLPLLGPLTSVRLAGTVNIALSALLMWVVRPHRVASVVAPAAVAAVAWILPGWNPKVVSSGAYLYGETIASAARDQRQDLSTWIEQRHRILASYWDSYGLVTVTQSEDDTLTLRVNGKADASTGGDMPTQLLLGHLPLLHHSAPRRGLVIGLGSGVTLGALTRYPLEKIDCIEISGAVLKAAEHFKGVNGDALHDPRVKVVVGDGRNAISFGKEPYDVIVSEPSNLWISGMANLFTREFFEQAARRLNPRGIMCQWLHAYLLPTEDFMTVLRTFYNVFPQGSVWEMQPGVDYILLGAKDSPRTPFAEIEARFSIPRVQEQIRDSKVPGVLGLLGGLVTDADGARRMAGPGPILSDDRCPIEYTAVRGLLGMQNRDILERLDQVRRTPVELSLYDGLNAETAARLARRREARRMLAATIWNPEHKDATILLQDLVEMASGCPPDAAFVRFLDSCVSSVFAESLRARNAGNLDAELALLRSIPKLSRRYGEAQLRMAVAYEQTGQRDKAEACLKEALQADPDSFAATTVRAARLQTDGKLLEAAEEWRKATTLQPKSGVYVSLATCLFSLGKREEARQACLKALQMDPANLEARRLLQAIGSPPPR